MQWMTSLLHNHHYKTRYAWVLTVVCTSRQFPTLLLLRRILEAVGNATCSVSVGIQQGSASGRSTFSGCIG
eukprot:11947303-Prorocentrum_lima.AAC.1